MVVEFVGWALRLIESIAILWGIAFVRGSLGENTNDLGAIKDAIGVTYGMTSILIGVLAAGLQTLIEHKK